MQRTEVPILGIYVLIQVCTPVCLCAIQGGAGCTIKTQNMQGTQQFWMDRVQKDGVYGERHFVAQARERRVNSTLHAEVGEPLRPVNLSCLHTAALISVCQPAALRILDVS